MKFEVKLRAFSTLKGIALDDEYDRLAFDEDDRRSEFPKSVLTFEISKDLAKTLGGFKNSNIIEYSVETSRLTKDDFISYGANGMYLNKKTVNEQRFLELLGGNNK